MTITINKGIKKSEIKKILKELDKKKSKHKGFDAKKYCGVIQSFKKLDPNKIQEGLRDEW